MAFRIYPYNMHSAAAGLLSNALGGRLIQNDRARSTYVPRPEHLVVGWGATSVWFDIRAVAVYLNEPRQVQQVSNKLRFFQNLHGRFNHPDWTTDRNMALMWHVQGHTVVVRHQIAGMGGEGIEIIPPDLAINRIDQIPVAPLYTKYIPKAAEYRVHIFNRHVIDIQQKVRRAGVEGNFLVRTHDNGFVFARTVNDRPVRDTVPHAVITQATAAVAASGLDFGGVDVIYNRQRGAAYVLEVNSAPGIEGTTVQSYADAIKAYYEDWYE